MLDPFTRRRLLRFVEEFRGRTGQLPTWRDLAQGGFPEDTVKEALKAKLIVELYLTLTNGTIVKGFKIAAE